METRFQPLAPAARTFWTLRGLIPIVLVLLPVVVATGFLQLWLPFGAASIAAFALGLWWTWIAGRRYRAWGYAELDRELIIRHGVLIERLSVVPYGRMQFIDVFQGPLDRMFGVATVKLHTAAAASDARIPFVSEAEAKRLRERLTELGESHAAGL